VSSDDAARWREERREAAAAHADALVRRQRAESAQASALIAQFVEEARVAGPPPVELRARSYNGRSRVRTRLRGWYLRRNETVGIDTEGRFYVLSAPGGLLARLRPADVQPSDPPLVLGLGGKDGETLDLAVALDRLREQRSS
jgi:hypothetical protein